MTGWVEAFCSQALNTKGLISSTLQPITARMLHATLAQPRLSTWSILITWWAVSVRAYRQINLLQIAKEQAAVKALTMMIRKTRGKKINWVQMESQFFPFRLHCTVTVTQQLSATIKCRSLLRAVADRIQKQFLLSECSQGKSTAAGSVEANTKYSVIAELTIAALF